MYVALAIRCHQVNKATEIYNLYQKLRERRNDITHELLKNLNNGFNETDAKLYVKLLELYQKIEKWWINEIENPISGEVLPDEYDPEQVSGGQVMILSIINDIIFDNNKETYKNLLEELRKLGIAKYKMNVNEYFEY